MILLENVKGQDSAVRFLQNSISTGRIANGYLFTGPDGTGKTSAAKSFIAALMCTAPGRGASGCGNCAVCRRVESMNHPDVTWIVPERLKRTGIEDIRRVKDRLSLKPYESSVNVCVIENAHMMTQEAANALLKVLEEPPGRSLIILISDKKENLLSTVVSRCVEVRFRHLSGKETERILREQPGMDDESAKFLALFSCGSPGRAIDMASRGLLERRKSIALLLRDIVREEDPAFLSWDRDDKAGLLEDMEFLVMFFRDIALRDSAPGAVIDKELDSDGTYGLFEKYTAEDIFNVIERLAGIRRALEGNVNPKLVSPVLPGMLVRG